MTDLEQLATFICKRPGMYVGCESFAAVCAYLNGYDAARDFGPLTGFHPWMVLRHGSGHNTGWDTLVLTEALGHPMPGRDIAELSAEQNRKCVATLGELLKEFFEERQRRTATAILHDYAKWLRRKKWYRGPLRS